MKEPQETDSSQAHHEYAMRCAEHATVLNMKAYAFERLAADKLKDLPDCEPTRSELYASAAVLAVRSYNLRAARECARIAIGFEGSLNATEKAQGILNDIGNTFTCKNCELEYPYGSNPKNSGYCMVCDPEITADALMETKADLIEAQEMETEFRPKGFIGFLDDDLFFGSIPI